MKGTRHNEEKIIAILKQCEARNEHGGVMPPALHHRADLLSLEGEVRWHGQQRGMIHQSDNSIEP